MITLCYLLERSFLSCFGLLVESTISKELGVVFKVLSRLDTPNKELSLGLTSDSQVDVLDFWYKYISMYADSQRDPGMPWPPAP